MVIWNQCERSLIHLPLRCSYILKHFKNPAFASMYISFSRPNISNHWYPNWQVRPLGLYSMPKSKCFIWRLPWHRIRSSVTQNWKFTDNVTLLYERKKSYNKCKDKKSSIFMPLSTEMLCLIIIPVLPKSVSSLENVTPYLTRRFAICFFYVENIPSEDPFIKFS